MTLFNFGSINIDKLYRCAHIPAPGETVMTHGLQHGLGGKGANQSVAAARAGACVRHIGAVGADGQGMLDELAAYGVDVAGITVADQATGHAIIYLDEQAENAIGVYPGANACVGQGHLDYLAAHASSGDWVIAQNETTAVIELAQACRANGLRLAYSAAPFELDAIQAVLPFTDLLAVNEIELQQVCHALGVTEDDLPVDWLLVTLGKAGARLRTPDGLIETPAFAVQALDTTCAGDTYLGYLMAGLVDGVAPADAMRRASAAAALAVTRLGASASIPGADEVDQFLAQSRL